MHKHSLVTRMILISALHFLSVSNIYINKTRLSKAKLQIWLIIMQKLSDLSKQFIQHFFNRCGFDILKMRRTEFIQFCILITAISVLLARYTDPVIAFLLLGSAAYLIWNAIKINQQLIRDVMFNSGVHTINASKVTDTPCINIEELQSTSSLIRSNIRYAAFDADGFESIVSISFPALSLPEALIFSSENRNMIIEIST